MFSALDCTDGDYKALFALGLLYAISHNRGKLIMLSCCEMLIVYSCHILHVLPATVCDYCVLACV